MTFLAALQAMTALRLRLADDEKAEPSGTANAGIGHAACYLMHFEMNPQNSSRHAARVAPASVVADL